MGDFWPLPGGFGRMNGVLRALGMEQFGPMTPVVWEGEYKQRVILSEVCEAKDLTNV